jgi:hypothetical protein
MDSGLGWLGERKAKARRLIRRGQISQTAAMRNVAGFPDPKWGGAWEGRKHDYDRTGVLKDDTIEASST